MNKLLTHIFIITTLVAVSLPAQGVTRQEMEQARAIAAIGYLRYANNASGYLDDVTASSLDDLQPKLKPTDAENLKAFRKISAFPPEYAQWDKEQMVKYWGETFFAGKDVPEHVRQARKRVTRKLNAMEVAMPAAVESKPDTLKTAEPVQPVEVEPIAPESELQPDTLMAQEEPVAAEPREESDYSTIIYIVILAVLVIIVIALVVYALNSMKSDTPPEPRRPEKKERRRPKAKVTEPIDDDDSEEVAQLKAKFAATIEEKNREIADLRMRLEAAEKLAADATARLTRASSAQAKPAPARREPTTVYLARANSAGDFVRADSRMNLGNSVFALATTDGLTGTYSVIDNPTVHEVALMMPTDYLINACSGTDLQQSSGMRRIVTDAPGTAVFDHGRWHITRKARIHYTK